MGWKAPEWSICDDDWRRIYECEDSECETEIYSRAREGDAIIGLCKRHMAQHLGCPRSMLPGDSNRKARASDRRAAEEGTA